MKKRHYLPILIISVFLLLCACAQNVTDQPETTPSSSVQPSSKPTSKPTSTPTIVPTVVTQPTTAPTRPTTKPTTAPTTAPTQPTTKPTTAPTKPTTPPPTTQPNLEWLTNRQIVPFEERFEEDVPFGYGPTIYHNSWLLPCTYPGYTPRLLEYHLKFYSYSSKPVIVLDRGVEEDDELYYVPISKDRFAGMKTLSADGRWGYFSDDSELCRLDLLTGELTTLATRNEGDIRWEVQACGKDTVCIFRIDADRNLHIFYRDLHSEAEKTLYEGVLPNVPTDADNLKFYASTTTQGQAYWETMNPAFYAVYLKEWNDPNSPLKNSADFYKAVQEHYKIPMLVRYACDFGTGALTEDFGLYDTCYQSTTCKHDHFDYENTWGEAPQILNVTPVEIPNFSKLIGEDQFWLYDACIPFLYSDFGHLFPYWTGDGFVSKLGDVAVIEIEMSNEYIYCITTEGTIIQFDKSGSICNTIYSSENKLSSLLCTNDCLYFVDGSTIICIDENAGTWRPIVQTSQKKTYLFYKYDYDHRNSVYFGVSQGMYSMEYQYDPETGELTEMR